jgi:hypothetical protein
VIKVYASHVHTNSFYHKHFGTNVEYPKLIQSMPNQPCHLIKGKNAGYEVVNYFENTKLYHLQLRFVIEK